MTITPTLLTPDDLVGPQNRLAQLETLTSNLLTQNASLRADVDRLLNVVPVPVPVQNRAPQLVGQVPSIDFNQGTPARISIKQYFTDPDGDPLKIVLLATVALPAGVTYDVATQEFVYDGIGAGGMTGGNILNADDGKP